MKMEIAPLTDVGTAEIFVDGVGRFEVIGDTVRLTFFNVVDGENRTILATRWSLQSFLEAITHYVGFKQQCQEPVQFKQTPQILPQDILEAPRH